MEAPIVRNFGLARIKARAPLWVQAMREGHAVAPRCCSTATMTGEPCRGVPLRGGSLCFRHLKADERDALDLRRAVIAQKKLLSTNARTRREAEVTLAAIRRRRQLRMWRMDKTLPGETLNMSSQQEQRVGKWLRQQHGIILGVTTYADGRPLTAYCVDQLRWAGALFLTFRITPEQAQRRVAKATREDLAWWRKHPDHQV